MLLVLWSSIGARGGDESLVAIDLKYGDGMLPATKGSVERQLYAIEISGDYYGNVPLPALNAYEIGWPLSVVQQMFSSRPSDSHKSA